MSQIAQAILAELARAGAAVTVTLDVEAGSQAGFDRDCVSVLSDNARDLRVRSHGFE